MKVIGTAGHIDHGKSRLVHRLTGIDPDRLEEEKRRGMTIDLGFAWLRLPSGQEVSIVDVPGHERFVKNMLAGVGGIDVALLVVAADEGVMPQTREHLDILDLLAIRRGVVALTKSDLVDDEWLSLAASEVEDALAGTTLEGSDIVPVSSVSGSGVDRLMEALTRELATVPEPPDRGQAYLPVDRVFTVGGFGTVVTGTLHDGTLRAGQEIEIVPSGRRARLRTLQTHGQQVDEAPPASRVAVNLAGVSREEIERGDVVSTPGTTRSVTRFDARLRVVGKAPFALEHGTSVTVHVGSAERRGTLSILGRDRLEPGEEGWVQLRVVPPVGIVPGQRFILRLPAPGRTVAGGEVAELAPRHRRSDQAALDRLEALASGDVERQVVAALQSHRSRSALDIAQSLRLGQEQVEDALRGLLDTGRVIRVGQAYVTLSSWNDLLRRAVEAVRAYHQEYPLRRGMPVEELRRKLHWQQPSWAVLLQSLVAGGTIRQDGPVAALPEHGGGLEARRGEADRVLAVLRRDPFSPPSGQDLIAAAGTHVDFLKALAEAGEIVRVGDGIYLAADAYERMVELTLSCIDRTGAVTVAQMRDAAGTSRKFALALLEHLDAARVTRRVGDQRVRGSKAPACA